MKSIRNVDVLYTIHEKSRVLEECICRVESACDTGHFESVDSALRTKPELRAALGAYIRQMLALLGMLTPQAYSTASLDVRDIQDLLQALQWEPDRVSAFWPDLCDACRTLYRLSGEQLDIYVRLTQPAYAADLHLGAPFKGLRASSPLWADVLLKAIPDAYRRIVDTAIEKQGRENR